MLLLQLLRPHIRRLVRRLDGNYSDSPPLAPRRHYIIHNVSYPLPEPQ